MRQVSLTDEEQILAITTTDTEIYSVVYQSSTE